MLKQNKTGSIINKATITNADLNSIELYDDKDYKSGYDLQRPVINISDNVEVLYSFLLNYFKGKSENDFIFKDSFFSQFQLKQSDFFIDSTKRYVALPPGLAFAKNGKAVTGVYDGTENDTDFLVVNKPRIYLVERFLEKFFKLDVHGLKEYVEIKYNFEQRKYKAKIVYYTKVSNVDTLNIAYFPNSLNATTFDEVNALGYDTGFALLKAISLVSIDSQSILPADFDKIKFLLEPTFEYNTGTNYNIYYNKVSCAFELLSVPPTYGLSLNGFSDNGSIITIVPSTNFLSGFKEIFDLENTSDDSFSVDTTGGIVLKAAKNITLEAVNIYFKGTTTELEMQDVNIRDVKITLNKDLTGAPPTLLESGIVVNRGTSNDYEFIFKEDNQTFEIGETGNTQPVATREDSSLITNGSTFIWDGATNRLKSVAPNTLVSGLNAEKLNGKELSEIPLLNANNTFTGIPAFNGGETGTSAPFTVDSDFLVSNLNADKVDGADLSTDATLAANSDSLVPTEKAIKTYIDNKITTTQTTINRTLLASDYSSLSEADKLAILTKHYYIPNAYDNGGFQSAAYKTIWCQELGMFVSICLTASNRVSISYDGIRWITNNSAFSTLSGSWDIAWSKKLGIFIVTKNSNEYWTSTNGTSWTQRYGPVGQNFQTVEWSDELECFVVLGTGQTNNFSTDGINWTTHQISAASRNWSDVIWTGIKFIAISDTYSATSTDGKNWTESSVLPVSGTWDRVEYSKELNRAVAISKYDTTKTKMLYSSDGLTWVENTVSTTSYYWNDCKWIPELGYFLATTVNTSNVYAISRDGINWIFKTFAQSFVSYASLAWSSDLGVLAIMGFGGSCKSLRTISINEYKKAKAKKEKGDLLFKGVDKKLAARSFRPVVMPSTQTIENLIWSAELGEFVALGSSSGAVSKDGISWKTVDTKGGRKGIEWSASLGLFVAISNFTAATDYISISSDGINWTQKNYLELFRKCTSIAWSEKVGLFVATINSTTTGNPYTNCATSPDGIAWTERTVSGTAKNWYDVKWIEELGIFIMTAGFGNKCVTSPDGISWTERTMPNSRSWYGITWSRELGLFVTVAYGSAFCATSPDGIDWTERSLPNSRSWAKIMWIPEIELFVISAYSSSVCAISSDGIMWAERIISNSSVDAVNLSWSSDLGILVAAGGNTNIAFRTLSPKELV